MVRISKLPKEAPRILQILALEAFRYMITVVSLFVVYLTGLTARESDSVQTLDDTRPLKPKGCYTYQQF